MPLKRRGLSEKQKHILEIIQQSLQENGYPPSVREIQTGAKISSTSVVKYNLERLEELGLIEQDKKISRGLRVTKQGREMLLKILGEERRGPVAQLLHEMPAVWGMNMLRIPVLGRIAAGEPIPIPASDFDPMGEKAILLTRDIVEEQEGLYALEVRGDSMIDALINDGDTVVMKHAQEARNGEMVAVWLKDREETTLKRFYREGRRVRLQPANPTMQPIYADPGNVEIQGRVVAVIRQVQ